MKPDPVLPFRATFESPGGSRRGRRMGWLTRYEVEILRSEARNGGTGSQLELFVPAGASDDGVAWVRSELEGLRRAGIGVAVKRDAAWEFRDEATARAGKLRRA